MTRIKTRRYRRKRGGFFTQKNNSTDPTCNNVNNLVDISNDILAMNKKYQQCCPKSWFRKNQSVYCKQLEKMYKEEAAYRNFNKIYEGDDAVVEPKKKPWYKFWGGKSRKRCKLHGHRFSKMR